MDLKTVVLRTPVNEWLDPMKEAPSNEGAFLFQVHPPSGRHGGVGTLRVWVLAAGAGRLRYGLRCVIQHPNVLSWKIPNRS